MSTCSSEPATAKSRVDHVDKMVACLEADGLTVERTDPVSFAAESPSGEAHLRSVVERCKSMVPPPPPREFDRETAVRVYEAWLGTVECIRQRGHDPGNPPEREAFIEQYIAQTLTWHPFGRWADRLDPAERDQLMADCPDWVA